MKRAAILSVIFFVIIYYPVSLFCDFTVDGGIEVDDGKKYAAFGLCLDLPQQRICNGINYSIGYKIAFSENSVYASAPGTIGGLLIAAAVFSENDDESDDDSGEETEDGKEFAFAAGVFLLIVPENVTFHFWLTPSIELGLGLHPWGMEYDMDDHSPHYCNGISLTINWIIDTRFLLSPFADFRYVYATDKPVISAGIRAGITF